MKKIKCMCCKKEIENLFNRKYCNNCATFTLTLRSRLSYQKNKFKKLNIKLYGVENGQQRIRFKK